MEYRDWPKRLAAALKKHRELCAVSLRELAAELDIGHATLCRIENERPCDVDTLYVVCRKLGVSIDNLFD